MTLQGEKHPLSKLTDAEARELKIRGYAGEPYAVLAVDYHISEALVCRIVMGAAWKHIIVPGEPPNKKRRGETHPSAVLTEETARQALAWLDAGYKGCEIAEHLHVSDATISNLKNGNLWKHLPRAARPEQEEV